MPAYSSEAIVLKSIDFGEADKIITFFTKDFGKIRGIAKSAKRSKKRFGAALEKGVYGRVEFFDKSNLALKRINSMEVISPAVKIWSDYKNLLAIQ